VKRIICIAAIAAVVPGTIVAQARALDRTKAPPVAVAPTFKLPTWTVDTLANGARLVVVEKHDLPIVSFSIEFSAGTNQLGAGNGVSNFVGGMMREGTATRTADQINNDLALLGTSVGFSVGPESSGASFSSLVRTFDSALEILVDMMLHSTFPAPALERIRTQSLAAYTRGQDNVSVISSQVVPKLMYGDQPYGKVTTDADVRAVTRDDVAALAKRAFVPINAIVYVVGDLTRADAKARLERAFKIWPAGGTKVVASYPAASAPASTSVYLVDMPNKHRRSSRSCTRCRRSSAPTWRRQTSWMRFWAGCSSRGSTTISASCTATATASIQAPVGARDRG
jgi:zinc protease